MTRLWYVNPVHPKETLLTGITRDGTFLIEDGRIAAPVARRALHRLGPAHPPATEALSRAPAPVSEAEFYGPRFATGSSARRCGRDGFRVTGVER